MATLTCPDSTTLRQMLNSGLPEPDQAEVIAHLDECKSCQVAIEHLSGGGMLVNAAKTSLHDTPPPADSAFWPALKIVEKELLNPAENLGATRSDPAVKVLEPRPLDFDFLDPADDPNHLGRLDRFEIIEMVGRGGMGIVFRAKDSCLQRTVAIKILDPGMTKNELAQSRFCREARSAAGVAHENVITIHHVEHDETKNLSYIVMQFVKGVSLQDMLDEGGRLPIREAVRIAAATAAGLAAAHANNLIHRDIKPGNVLIEESTGRVLLTDFGLARADADVRITQSGFVAGTPLYMSPEQARGEKLDFHSDLFSLGGVLYAMLTGDPPFQGSSAFVVLRQVTEGRHHHVRDLNPDVPSKVAEIVDRLLEKDPKNRYDSASEVAALLNAELHKLPFTVAKPSTLATSTTRSVPRYVKSWWRRNSVAALASIGVFLSLFLLLELAKISRFTLIGQRGTPPEVIEIEVPGPSLGVGQRSVPVGPAPKYTLQGDAGAVWALAFDPCDELMATGTEDGTVKIWDAKQGTIKGPLNNMNSPVWAISFNHDGTRLATASDDGFVRIWNTGSRQSVIEYKADFPLRSVAYSPDGKRIAGGTRNGQIFIWDVEGGAKLPVSKLFGDDLGVIMSLSFSPTGEYLASGGSDKIVRIWDLQNGAPMAEMKGHTGPVYTVAYNPKQSMVASAGWDHRIRIWDVNTSSRTNAFETHREDIWALAFYPDGNTLLSGGQDGTMKSIDVKTGKIVETYSGNNGPVHSVAVSKDGKMIASGSRDGTVKVWIQD